MAIGKGDRANSVTSLIHAVSCANTAAATSSWVDVRFVKGDIAIVQDIGVVTAGSITGKMQSATDDQGTGAADITGAAFTAVSSSNNTQKLVISRANGPYVRYVGTIATGPAVASVTMLSRLGESAQ